MQSSPPVGGGRLVSRLSIVLLAVLTATLTLPAAAEFVADTAEPVANLNGAVTADFNHDGRMDGVINTGSEGEPGPSILVFGDQTGPADVTATHAPMLSTSVADWRDAVAADLNNDGNLDFVRSGRTVTNGVIEIYLNNGPNNEVQYSFETPIRLLLDSAMDPDGLGLMDYDGDRFLDIVVSARGVQIYTNPGPEGSEWNAVNMRGTGLPFPNTDPTDGVTLADLNDDGRVDLLIPIDRVPDVYQSSEPEYEYESLALPDFTLPPSSTPRAGHLVCDFDNDGELDIYRFGAGLAAGGNGYQNGIFLRRGDSYVATSLPDPGPVAVVAAACADVDNDGDLDLYLMTNGADQLHLNESIDGTVQFLADNQGILDGDTPGEAVIAADVDADGDIDITMLNAGDSTLWRNNLTENQNDFVRLTVLGDYSSCNEPEKFRNAVGATVTIHTETETVGIRHINGGTGTRGNHHGPLHIGLTNRAETKYTLAVRHPDPYEPQDLVFAMPTGMGGVHELTYWHDRDRDNDFIEDRQEVFDGKQLASPSNDLDQDGLQNWVDTDSDGDGVPDAIEAGDENLCTEPADSDENGIPDYLDASVQNGDDFFLEGSGCTCGLVTRDFDARGATAGVLFVGFALCVVMRRRRRRV